MKATCVDRPDATGKNGFYPSNRAPLLPTRLVRLPLGAVRARGWLGHQLALMTDGMTGRLDELSDFLKPDNGWFGSQNEGWEEQPYWLRGFYDLAVLTGDERCLSEAHRWIEAVLSSQDTYGYFGAPCHKRRVGDNGQVMCDLWPHMVMLDAVIHHEEHTGDARVVPFMIRFFTFCRDVPDELFMPVIQEGFGDWKPSIQHARAGDMVPHLFWLYNRTGDAWLLDLARRFQSRILPPGEWLDDHIVNFTQRFRYPGVYAALTHDPRHMALTDYWYAQHLGTWGHQPRGIFAADERIRPGKVDPRQGFETCGMVEFAKSFYLLGELSGDSVYADRCEDIMLNHFPAAQTPDLKGLHYLTASNQPQLDASEEHDYYNKGRQICYSPSHSMYRCCQHDVAMGWPWYVENLWRATPDNGLVAWLYGACNVTARVGTAGATVTVTEETAYPFEGHGVLRIDTAVPVSFPLYLRVPRWCNGFTVKVNDAAIDVTTAPGRYLRLEREWQAGDTVEFDMPMETALTTWPRTGAVSVDRGPLTYSVRIEEDWRRCGGTDAWPEWEVFPTTPWNYGLVSDDERPGGVRVVERAPAADQPWTVDGAPLELEVRAKRIPGWGLEHETVQPLRESPIRSDEPEETIRMIPLGCARLRMACLPVVDTGPEAQEW